VLDQLCRFLPKGSVACFAVVNRFISSKCTPDLDWIPIEYHTKPIERAIRPVPGRAGDSVTGFIESLHEERVMNTLLPNVIDFGRRQRVDRLWCLLEGQTMVRLAHPVSMKLGIPLYTQVWDPFSLWLRSNKIDVKTTTRLLEKFDTTIRASRVCATASWAMSEEYSAKYGVKNIPVISSLDSESALSPAEHSHQSDEFIIGMAGQIYAMDEWNALVGALKKCHWQIRGKKIRFRILSRKMPPAAKKPRAAEYLGWLSQQEAIIALSKVDMLYLPYWFSSKFREEAMYAFPSKLVTYFAAGRPVMFHGPDYASPARYLEKNSAAMCCYTMEPDQIIEKIKELILNTELYKRLTQNGATAFARDFTTQKMKESFYSFLEYDVVKK